VKSTQKKEKASVAVGDPISAYVSLGSNSVSRLGAVDLTASLHKEEIRVHGGAPAPHFMLWDAVKMRYLMDTGVLTALTDAVRVNHFCLFAHYRQTVCFALIVYYDN
jgi:hypothetical protein